MRRWMIFVAHRLLSAGRRRGGSVGGLATIGLAAGVATLIVVLAVMNGFQFSTIESILEVNSFHIRITSDVSPDSLSEITQTLNRISETRGVRVVVPTVEFQTLARGFWPEPQAIVVRAVPANWRETDSGARERITIVSGRFDLETPGSIVVGAELARILGVRVGDSVAVTHIPDGGSRPAEQSLTVTGTFRTGYLDFDQTWAFMSIPAARASLAVSDPVVIGVKLDNRFRDAEVIAQITALLPPTWETESWRVFNRGIFGALRVEKTMMVLLIGLIFVVVGGNIYQLLRRSILERSEEIAILRALGAGTGELRRVFALEGWIIGAIGSAAGVTVGLLIAFNINGIFTLLEWLTATLTSEGVRVFSPSYFYIETVPSRIPLREVLLVAAGATGISGVSATIAGRSVLAHAPMELLRGE